MEWDGRIGPTAILAFGIAVVQVLNFIGDNRADIGNRLVKLEITMLRAVADISDLSSELRHTRENQQRK